MDHDNECGLYTTVTEGSLKVRFVIFKDHFGSLVEKRTEGDKYENRQLKGSL